MNFFFSFIFFCEYMWTAMCEKISHGVEMPVEARKGH